MDIKEIIINLEHYNNWRRDDDNKYTMPDPKQIGITIDAAISELKKLLTHNIIEKNEPLKRNNTCFMRDKDKHNDGHTCCEDCSVVSVDIVDSDIATIEALHDLLLDVHGYSLDFIPLKRARELTAKMYKAFD